MGRMLGSKKITYRLVQAMWKNEKTLKNKTIKISKMTDEIWLG